MEQDRPRTAPVEIDVEVLPVEATGAVLGGPPSGSSLARVVHGPLVRLSRSGFGRIAGISASLVGTLALTSVIGLAFWALAARLLPTAQVGVAGAAVALMLLLGSLGTVGLGTLLIARLPGMAQADRRSLVRTSLVVATAGGVLLGLAVPAAAVHLAGARGLAPVAGGWVPLLVLAGSTGLTAAVMVLDQAVLVIGAGTIQLERNVLASGTKVLALAVLSLSGQQDGMVVLIAWSVGNLVSLPLVAFRTRTGRSDGRPLVEVRMLHGLGRQALSHHALNVTVQAALQLLPVLVTVLVSAQQNASFNAALMVSSFVFAVPYAVSVALFAAARGDAEDVIRRMRLTVPFALAVSVAADVVIWPLAEPVLHVFGPQYAADGAVLLRIIVLAGLPVVIKDHFIALRRVQGRTTQALVVTAVFLAAELAGAGIGAAQGGAIGLSIGWVAVLVVEALVLAVPLVLAYRRSALVADPGVLPIPGTRLVPSARPRVGIRVPPRPEWWRRNLAGPTLTVMAFGVLAMTAAANMGRAGSIDWVPQAAWEAGLVLVFLPAAVRIVGTTASAGERVGLAVGVAVMLQVSRLVLNPTSFVFHDELIHAETLRQIEATGRLFTANPLLPVSGYYPGLEIATNGVADITGLPPFGAAVVVLLLARVILVLGILRLVKLLTGSDRAGALGALVYVTNSQLLFFNSQYSYQTLALPLALFALYLAASTRSVLLPVAATTAVILTHHLTGALLVVAFSAWLVLIAVRGHRILRFDPMVPERVRVDGSALPVLTGWGGLMLTLTAVNPGNPIATYLQAIAGSSGGDLLQLVQGRQTKALFADTAGTGPAPWEQVLVIAAVLIATASVVVAFTTLRAERRVGRGLVILLAALALLYPVIPAGHLTRATAEVGDRGAGFIFIGIASVIGAWWFRRRRRFAARVAFTVGCTIVFLGDVVLGAGPTAGQLPGPYQISADARSVDGDNLAAARWLSVGVPTESTVYADRTAGLLAAAVGTQRTITHVATGIDASRLLLAPTFTDADRALIHLARIDYLVVDERLSDGLPHQSVYIESGEFGGDNPTTPVSARALTKFATVPGVQRIYDNGGIVIYDVRALR